MENITQQKVINGENIIYDGYLFYGKAFYLYYFNALPNVNVIYSVNGEKALKALLEKYKHRIKKTYFRNEMGSNRKRYELSIAFLVLDDRCVLEVGEDYCDILYPDGKEDFVTEVTNVVRKYRERQKREPFEINLIIKGADGGLSLKSMVFKKTKLDINLYYEDDFKAIDELIFTRLNKSNDKGIVLLHGIPGTGKTTYLRYLIGRLKKRVLFLSPSMAGGLMQPTFLELLIRNPNTVLVIEDAENIIMDRKVTGDSTVSNLLNLSDGLLADCMNVQIICTFNSELSLIDSALLRKGRLIARYEFGKLSALKAQYLSDKQGFNTVISQPMTVAEVMNQHEQAFEKQKTPVIGFRAGM